MSEEFLFKDHVMMIAGYKDPKPHKHLASHIMISLGSEMEWQIEGALVRCRGICIGSNVVHTGKTSVEGTLVFLFTEISNYAMSLNGKYLHGKPYAILEDEVVNGTILEYEKFRRGKEWTDKGILSSCGIRNDEKRYYEDRIWKALEYINGLKTIENSIIDELSQRVHLSKSRLSHLFKQETGMTLHSYLAFEKLRKTHRYFRKGKNITESCMLAGFDSPSHCAASCKRMFGISLREVYKTIATN